ncbi:hypothetical protein DENSPDRAFT_197334 [Dentipellis sp. KUC8613]|nr:hypothetical protein DENSPDRAFT_197334 [Dentipellis sp. KUC8613]
MYMVCTYRYRYYRTCSFAIARGSEASTSVPQIEIEIEIAQRASAGRRARRLHLPSALEPNLMPSSWLRGPARSLVPPFLLRWCALQNATSYRARSACGQSDADAALRILLILRARARMCVRAHDRGALAFWRYAYAICCRHLHRALAAHHVPRSRYRALVFGARKLFTPCKYAYVYPRIKNRQRCCVRTCPRRREPESRQRRHVG